MPDLRLFIAVELPDEARRLLAAVVRELAESRADVKWSHAENIHLTLKFLGDTSEEELPRLTAALDEAAAAVAAHAARLADVGAFPDLRRPRVIWVGLQESTGRLLALQKRVDEATTYLVAPDRRGFTPHLTLGRVRGSRNLRELSALAGGYRLASPAEIPVREIILIRSRLAPGGPTYTPLHRSPLAAS